MSQVVYTLLIIKKYLCQNQYCQTSLWLPTQIYQRGGVKSEKELIDEFRRAIRELDAMLPMNLDPHPFRDEAKVADKARTEQLWRAYDRLEDFRGDLKRVSIPEDLQNETEEVLGKLFKDSFFELYARACFYGTIWEGYEKRKAQGKINSIGE